MQKRPHHIKCPFIEAAVFDDGTVSFFNRDLHKLVATFVPSKNGYASHVLIDGYANGDELGSVILGLWEALVESTKKKVFSGGAVTVGGRGSLVYTP